MEPSKQRKSWFCASPTYPSIKLIQPRSPIVDCGFIKTTANEPNIQVTLSSDENEVPTTVIASDILTLTTFSRRAVVDFGVVSVTGRPVKRYLLVENPHPEDQSIAIQCGLPPNEFCLDWIGSKTDRLDRLASRPHSSTHSSDLNDPSVNWVRANQGRSLLQITWIPSASGSGTSSSNTAGFHHIVHFRVNDAYPLQVMVVGRFAMPPPERSSRFKPPKRALHGPPSVTGSIHATPHLPSWTRTPLNELPSGSTGTRSCFIDNQMPTLSLKPAHFMSIKSKPTESEMTTILKQRSISHDRLLHPAHPPTLNQLNCGQQVHWQSDADLPHLLSTKALEEQLAALERQKTLLSSALTLQHLRSTSDSQNQDTIAPSIISGHKPFEFTPLASSAPQSPKRPLPCNTHLLESVQSTRTTIRRSSSIGRLNLSFSCTDFPAPPSNADLSLVNATAIGYLSPHLVRSPALKGDPILLTTKSPMKRVANVPHRGNLFHPDFAHTLSEVSEHGLTQWLNSVFAPCVAANAAAYHTQSSDCNSSHVCTPGTTTYLVAVAKAVRLLQSSVIVGPGQRLEREVDEGKIVLVRDLSFFVDKGAQRRLLDQLLTNYAPIWLHLAVDALSSAMNSSPIHDYVDQEAVGPSITLPDQMNASAVPLSKKLLSYMFTATSRTKSVVFHRPKDNQVAETVQQSAKARSDKAATKPAQKASRDSVHNRYAVKRFLILVWFLDRLKVNRLIKYNPCLFRAKSHIKASSELLLQFSRNFLSGENNLVRHLANLGVRVEVVQSPLDEYQLTVTNLAVDLRDGIRLVKLAELLIPSLPQRGPKDSRLINNQIDPASLMSLVRFPAISRLQKIHNVSLALKAFEQSGRVSMPDGGRIDPRDIVDGHREKCLTLLWCLLLRYQVLALVNVQLLDEEIARLRGQLPAGSLDTVTEIIRGMEQEEGDISVHAKLLHWASLVGRIHGLLIDNLDESFADGRALCFLVHHYLPTVMPQGLIRQLTTSSASEAFSTTIPIKQLARNNRYNLLLFQRKLSFLGDMPALLTLTTSHETSYVLPPGLVLATLAYLASRLVLVSKERQQLVTLLRDHAARILQAAWRRFRHRREVERMHLHSPNNQPKMFTPHLTDKARKSFFGTPASPAMQQFFNARHSRTTALAQSPSKFEDDRVPAVVRLQAVVRGFLVRRRLHIAFMTRREHAARLIQRAFRRHREQKRADYLRRCHQSAVLIQKYWRSYSQRQRYRRQCQFVLDLQTLCRRHFAREQAEQRVELTLIHDRAALCIQSTWRTYKRRQEFLQTRASIIQIQNWWRSLSLKRHLFDIKRFVVQLQAVVRGFLARRMYAQQLARYNAAVRIQSCWRSWRVRHERNARQTAAVQIQAWWRCVRARRLYLTQYQATVRLQQAWRRTCIRREQAARRIQFWWRVQCRVSRQLAHQNRAAARIQAFWRGLQTRRKLALLAGVKRIAGRPVRAATGRAAYSGLTKSHSQRQCGLIDPAAAQRLIDVRVRLQTMSQTALPSQSLASRARNAIQCILQSKSVSQVFDAIKSLELCTRLSMEVCYWAVGIHRPKGIGLNAQPGRSVTDSPRLHLMFLHLIQGCNRSIPHEDILLSVAGILLNLIRHRPLAECVQLWWTVPIIDETGADANRWVSPALLHHSRSRLDRSESLTRAGGDESMQSELDIDEHIVRRRDSSTGRVTGSLRTASPIQTSMAEALVGILLRTCRARPGTPGVRLFARVCCVLAVLCQALPPQLVPTSSLIPVCEQLSNCLARRAASSGFRHLHLNPAQERLASTQPHSSVLREQAEALEQRQLLYSQLRKLLSCELDWHLYPTKTRADPLVAVDFLLLVLLDKLHNR